MSETGSGTFPTVLQELTDTLCLVSYLNHRPTQVTPGCDPGPLVPLALGAWVWFVGLGVWCIGPQIRRANLFVADSFMLQTGPWSQMTCPSNLCSSPDWSWHVSIINVPKVPSFWSHWTLCEWDKQQINCTLCSLAVQGILDIPKIQLCT